MSVSEKKLKRKIPKKDNDYKLNDDEQKVLNKISEDLQIDIENETDLEEIPNNPELSGQELEKIIEDKSIKTIIRDSNDAPTISDTLSDNTVIGQLTKEDLTKIQEESNNERNKLIVTLAAFPTIKLHLNAGMREGKTVWIEKEFPFNAIDKWQELKINTLRARMQTISLKHALLQNKKIVDLTEDESNFLMKSSYMIEISGYRLSEYEAKLRLGMSPEDFARVNVDEYTLALQVLLWRTNNRPSFKRRQ